MIVYDLYDAHGLVAVVHDRSQAEAWRCSDFTHRDVRRRWWPCP